MKKPAHTQYRVNNKVVPSTTAVIENLGWNKQALISWAIRTSSKGQDANKIKTEAANIGTLTHSMIEKHIQELSPNLFMYYDNIIKAAKVGFNAYLKWELENNPEYMHTELKLTSKKYKYGGTIDLVLIMKNRLGIVNLKTSKGIYQSHILQLAAYRQLLNESKMHTAVDFCAILKLDKTNGDFEYYNIDLNRLDKAFEAFKHCLALHNLKYEI